jgi:hypothetical protein
VDDEHGNAALRSEAVIGLGRQGVLAGGEQFFGLVTEIEGGVVTVEAVGAAQTGKAAERSGVDGVFLLYCTVIAQKGPQLSAGGGAHHRYPARVDPKHLQIGQSRGVSGAHVFNLGGETVLGGLPISDRDAVVSVLGKAAADKGEGAGVTPVPATAVEIDYHLVAPGLLGREMEKILLLPDPIGYPEGLNRVFVPRQSGQQRGVTGKLMKQIGRHEETSFFLHYSKQKENDVKLEIQCSTNKNIFPELS